MDSAGGGPDFVIIDGEDFVEVERAHIAAPLEPDHSPEIAARRGLVYSCMMETPVFLQLTRAWFTSWRRDCVSDFTRTPPEDGTVEAWWHDMGAPLLADLIDASPALAGALLKPNGHHICSLCGARDRTRIRYLMMSVDELIVTPKVVRIDGVAVRLG